MTTHIRSAARPLGAAVVLAVFVLLASGNQAKALESGTSHYIQGAYGDYVMGLIPGEGFYVRNDFIYMSQTLGQSLKGDSVYGKINANTAINLLKLSYIFDVPAIGGYAGVGIGLPFILDTNVNGTLSINDPRSRNGGFSKSDDSSRGGLSDIFLMPLILGWNFGECHLTLLPIVFLPTGYYDKTVLSNLGMNYASFDANMAFTWLSKMGMEVSFDAGYMINAENQATNYLSGNQFHVDATAAFHFSERFALGVVGYAVTQTTPDSGKGATLGSYMSSGVGIGPTIVYTAPIAGKDVSFIAKWLHDLVGENRLKGDALYGSIAVKF